MENKIDIEKAIPQGRENALYQEEIANKLNITPHLVKMLVKEARQQGSLILSDTCGYWMAESVEETQEFIDRSEKNAKTRLKTIKAIKQSLKIAKGQQALKLEVTK